MVEVAILMTWMQFIASMVGSLAWPIAIIVILVVFHRPLVRVIESLRRLSYKGIDIDFGQELAKVAATPAAEALLKAPVEPAKVDDHTEAASGTLDSDINPEIATLVAISPAAAVVQAWQQIEHSLRDAMKRLGFDKRLQDGNYLRQTVLLRDGGYIDDETSRLLNSLRKLRNQATHAPETGQIINSEDALDYARLVKLVARRLDSIELKP
jgi:hypothetical protein